MNYSRWLNWDLIWCTGIEWWQPGSFFRLNSVDFFYVLRQDSEFSFPAPQDYKIPFSHLFIITPQLNPKYLYHFTSSPPFLSGIYNFDHCNHPTSCWLLNFNIGASNLKNFACLRFSQKNILKCLKTKNYVLWRCGTLKRGYFFFPKMRKYNKFVE